MEVKEIIKKYRKAAHLTQTKLGEEIGVGLSTIARYESGDIKPPIDKIDKMADIFGHDFRLECLGMEMYFPYEASFNYQLIKELSEFRESLDDGMSLIVTIGLKKFVVKDEDIEEFCNRSKEYLAIAFKHFLIDKGTYNGLFSYDDYEEEEQTDGTEI